MYQKIEDFKLPENFRGRLVGKVQLWWIIQAMLIHTSPQFMYGWRNLIYRLCGAKIGKKVLLRPSIKCVYPWKLSIGNYSWIGDDVSLYTLGEIEIGNNTVISQNCYLCTGSHDYTKPSFDIYAKKITIGDEVWLASDVLVGPGVNIGDGTVVGVRSTVLHDLPGGMICYGNPAKPIRPRVMKEN
jgi:putative colanic acid biosynthesis acetyltransferase WcaF